MKKHPSNKKIEFCDMSKSEKKNFLSMDLAERMIRIEQKVSEHFHKPVQYNETEYYKSLNPLERKEFQRHILANKAKKICLTALIVVPIAVLIVLNTSITAGVINETLGINYSNSTNFFIWVGAMIFAIGILINSLSKRITESYDDSHLDIFDKLSVRRRVNKNNKKGF